MGQRTTDTPKVQFGQGSTRIPLKGTRHLDICGCEHGTLRCTTISICRHNEVVEDLLDQIEVLEENAK